MNFIVFPGQGSQKIGMGKKLSENFPEAKEVFDEVNDALNINLTKIMWEGLDSEISLTTNAQPALMACGVASYRVLSKLENKNLKELANFTCGHSLGEYTAMTVAKVFSLKECAILLRLRGEAMQKAVPVGKGAMAALIGIRGTLNFKLFKASSIITRAGSINLQWNGALTGSKIALLAPLFLAISIAFSTAFTSPLITTWPSALSFPISQIP